VLRVDRQPQMPCAKPRNPHYGGGILNRAFIHAQDGGAEELVADEGGVIAIWN
jgi:hypothetical protein